MTLVAISWSNEDDSRLLWCVGLGTHWAAFINRQYRIYIRRSQNSLSSCWTQAVEQFTTQRHVGYPEIVNRRSSDFWKVSCFASKQVSKWVKVFKGANMCCDLYKQASIFTFQLSLAGLVILVEGDYRWNVWRRKGAGRRNDVCVCGPQANIFWNRLI